MHTGTLSVKSFQISKSSIQSRRVWRSSIYKTHRVNNVFIKKASNYIGRSISSCRFLSIERQTDSVEFTNSSLGYASQFRCRISESFTSSMYRK
ncbi:MAG: hypothetical protein MHPSP_004065 [Paramarteilia canceri]